MLRQFHYIDQNGKDQGINVRNRSGELVKLLSDVEAIRAERKKSRANKNKYGGVEGGAGLGMGFSSGASGRYGGFGSESAGYGGYQGEVYGDGGGFGGRETDFSGTQRRGDQFEEYDAEEEGAATTTSTTTAPPRTTTSRKAPAKQKEPVPDLFEFGEDEPPATSNGKAPSNVLDDFGSPQSSTTADDDDFDDFQSAASPATVRPAAAPFGTLSPPLTTSTTTSATQFAAPQPIAPAQTANLNSLFAGAASPAIVSPPPSNISSPPPQPHSTPVQPPLQAKPAGPNYYTSVNSAMNTSSSTTSAFGARPTMASSNHSSFSSASAATLGKPTPKPSTATGGDVFGNLWSSASTRAGVPNKGGAAKGPDLASMAKAKSTAGIWGAAAAPTAPSQPRPGAIAPSPNAAAGQGRPQAPLGNGLDDLLG